MYKEKNNKKNILIFFWYYAPPGGAELFIKEITERLSENYNFEIITAQCKKNLAKTQKTNRVLIHRVGIGNFFIDKFFFPFFSIFKAFTIKKNKKIALIHGVIANPAGFSAMIFHKITKIPFLITEQSGNLYRQVKEFGPIGFWLYKKIYQEAGSVHVISNFLKRIVLSVGVKEEKIKVIPNGVNLSELRPASEQATEKQKHRIVCIARLEEYKGIEYLINALPKILKKFPNSKLILIGDGSERRSLEFRVENLGLKDRIEFRGDVPYERIPKELAKSEVFVLPSLQEGQGLAVLEAQAAQIPVVTTNVGGIPDFIKDGKTGILIEPKDSERLAESVIKIFSNPEFAQKLIKNAAADLERYDWDNIASKTAQIYQRLTL